MERDEHLIDSLIRKILRGDASPEVKQDSFDLLAKLAQDGSRSARSLVRRLKFDTEGRRWTLRSADEIRTRQSRTGKQERRLSNGRMIN